MFKKKLVILIGMFFLLVSLSTGVYVFGILGWDGFSTRAQRELWREKSRRLIEDTHLGMTEEDVLKISENYGWINERIIIRETEIRLYNPIEFGASNWVIIFGFSDGKLSSVRVRTEDIINDNPRYKPKDAHLKIS